MSCQGCIEWLRLFRLTLQRKQDDGTNPCYFYKNKYPLYKEFLKREIEGRKNSPVCGPLWCVTMVLFSNPSTFSTLPQSNLEPRGVTAEDSFWYNKIQFGCKKNRARLCLRHPSAAWILLNCWGKFFVFLVNTLLICLKNLIPWKKKRKRKSPRTNLCWSHRVSF